MIDPGKMNWRVTARGMRRTEDGGGGYTETPYDIATTDAFIEPLTGDEQTRAMQTGLVRPHRLTMRYRSDITLATEFVYKTQRFDVKSIVDVEMMHEQLQVLADEITL